MGGQSGVRNGPIEGTSRVLRELLRTPNFKKSVKILLGELDPENAALLVRTLLWTDPELFMSLLGAVPSLLNSGVAGARELGKQLAGFPPMLLSGFIAQVVEGIDAGALGETVGNHVLLLARLHATGDPAVSEAVARFREGFARGLVSSLSAEGDGGSAAGLLLDSLMPLVGDRIAKLAEEAAREGSGTSQIVEKLVKSIGEVSRENPEFFSKVVAPLVDAGRDALASAERHGRAGDE